MGPDISLPFHYSTSKFTLNNKQVGFFYIEDLVRKKIVLFENNVDQVKKLVYFVFNKTPGSGKEFVHRFTNLNFSIPFQDSIELIFAAASSPIEWGKLVRTTSW